MSDSVWYYARGEQEKGPITTVQIKALAVAGKINKEDFVWKEGMENWVPAGEVSGLFTQKAATDANSNADLSTKQGQARPAALPRPTGPTGVPLQTRTLSRVVFGVGLMMALLSRGCDSLGDRNVARKKAIAESDRREFQDMWVQKKATLQSEQQRLQSNSNRSNMESTRLQELSTAVAELDGQRTKQERELEATEWLANDQAASAATANDRIWSYWRQVTLLFATMLLTCGALGVAYSSDGPERWISFVLLVVIVFNLFSASSVWSRIFT